jgi:hypothetical protein
VRAILDRLPLLAGLTFLALAIGFGAVAIGDGIRGRDKHDVISVTGSAKRSIVSNYIVWNASVTSQAATPQRALVQLKRWESRVGAFLRQEGAQDGEITVAPISTETVNATDANGNATANVIGYKLTRNFEVRSPRVSAIAKLVEDSSNLLGEGIPLQAQAAQYLYTRLAALRPELLAAATQDALNRARVLVKSTGGHLGSLRSVNVGVFQVTSPNSTDVSDSGIYDTSTLKKDVTAVVNVAFALG